MRRFALLLAVLPLVLLRRADAEPNTTLPPAPRLTESSWNGDRVLGRTRNTAAIPAAAASGYRSHIGADGRLGWEIPALHEVVQGRLDNQPMPIRRSGSAP